MILGWFRRKTPKFPNRSLYIRGVPNPRMGPLFTWAYDGRGDVTILFDTDQGSTQLDLDPKMARQFQTGLNDFLGFDSANWPP